MGFMPVPVFRYEDTYGQDLPVYEPKSPPPLLEVAERFGMRVQYERLAPGVYGATDHTNKTIVLATEDCGRLLPRAGPRNPSDLRTQERPRAGA